MVDIVADIGGTNARFACYRPADNGGGKLEHIMSMRCADYENIYDAAKHYCQQSALTPHRLSLAVAGPVDSDMVSLTNNHWVFSKAQLKAELKLTELMAINDFTAQAMLPPHLDETQKLCLRAGQPVDNTPILVLGPGTGLGFSALIPIGQNWRPLETEGGNILFAPRSLAEIELLQSMLLTAPFVSFEMVLSGRGFEAIYAYLTGIPARLTASEITASAEQDCLARQAIIMFIDILASYISTGILITGSRQAVYISGGIISRLHSFIAESDFSARLAEHGVYSEYVGGVPIYMVTADGAGLLGAGLGLDNPYLGHRRL